MLTYCWSYRSTPTTPFIKPGTFNPLANTKRSVSPSECSTVQTPSLYQKEKSTNVITLVH